MAARYKTENRVRDPEISGRDLQECSDPRGRTFRTAGPSQQTRRGLFGIDCETHVREYPFDHASGAQAEVPTGRSCRGTEDAPDQRSDTSDHDGETDQRPHQRDRRCPRSLPDEYRAVLRNSNQRDARADMEVVRRRQTDSAEHCVRRTALRRQAQNTGEPQCDPDTGRRDTDHLSLAERIEKPLTRCAHVSDIRSGQTDRGSRAASGTELPQMENPSHCRQAGYSPETRDLPR